MPEALTCKSFAMPDPVSAEPAPPIRLLLCLILALNLFIYHPSAGGPYIVDDIPNLVNNDFLILQDFSIESIKNAALSSPASRFYRPVAMLSFAANYTFSGDKSPYAVKLTNILLHLLTGLGIFLLTINLLPRLLNRHLLRHDKAYIELTGLLVTSVWLFHPLFVSTVLYAIQRMAILSALFTIYGCLFYIKLRLRTLRDGRGFPGLFLVSGLLTLLAFFSKENGALLPGFLLLIELFCFGFCFHPRTSPAMRPAFQVLLVLPVILVIAYLLYTYLAHMHALAEPYDFTYHERLLTQFRVMWRYAGWLTFLNPEPMGIYHDNTPVSTGLTEPLTTLFALLCWIAVLCVAAIRFRTRHILVFCLLWFLWGHILESTVLPLGIMYEHRNYLPAFGLLLAFAILLWGVISALQCNNSIKFGLVFTLFFLLPVYTQQARSSNWQDKKSLTLALLQQQPDSAQTLIMTARFLNDSGDFENAQRAVQYAQQLDPREPSHIMAEAALHCDRQNDKQFSNRLAAKLLQLPLADNVSVNTVRQFRQLTDICRGSMLNSGTLLELYNQLSRHRNNTLAMLAYYGIGAIRLQRGEYGATVEAWENAIDKDSNAAGLLPALQWAREQYQQQLTQPGQQELP
jgi:cytochrome c-type biogenesis protein CcmH/NrfG